MAFRAISFAFMCIVVNGTSDPGATCGSKNSACTAEGGDAPQGGRAMLQKVTTQSTQVASGEREDLQRQEVTLAAVGRVAKGHVAVGNSLAQLNHAKMLATTQEGQAKVKALEAQLFKAQEELRLAKQAAAEVPPQEVEEEDAMEPGLALAEDEAAESDPLDQKDLLLLAAASDDDVNLTAEAMAEIGWTPGVLVKFEQGMFRDHAWTFIKDGRCLATFAATNDMMDVQQVLSYDPMDFCRFSDVHSGLVGELVGFMQSAEWDDFIEFLNGPDCESVTAVGHSLGGALATLFAASANRGCDLFGNRQDFGLVTYAPFATSRNPFFSRRRGQEFVGTRYGITELDGGMDGASALPADVEPFRMAILEFFANMSTTMGDESSTFFERQLRKADRQGIAAVSWHKVEREAVPLLTLFRIHLQGPQPGMEFLHTTGIELLIFSIRNGFLNFARDPISTMSSYRNTGVRLGYTHPLVAFQPVANPLKAPGTGLLTRVEASEGASDLPRGDFFQDHLAILGSGNTLPNHAACCYSTVPQCTTKFTVPWKECTFSPLR